LRNRVGDAQKQRPVRVGVDVEHGLWHIENTRSGPVR
jgi:hypothetical protein